MKIKVKPQTKRSYQSYPIVDGMIEFNSTQLEQLGITLEFDDALTKLVPLVKTKEELAEQEKREKEARKIELKNILTAYTEDFAQSVAGLIIPDLEKRKKHFIKAHDELRTLEGKSVRNR